MNPKYDINASDEDNDFESTHRDLEAYVRGGQERNAGLQRLVWERKAMRRIKSLEKRVGEIEDREHDTAEIAIIAQREVGPARKFVEAIIRWKRRITVWVVGAGVTVGVAWFLAKYLGIKAP